VYVDSPNNNTEITEKTETKRTIIKQGIKIEIKPVNWYNTHR